jgi:CMP-N,N'-diacetyllegionaminic acid synthase
MRKMPHILAVIPARSGSKGIPHKNIRLLAGKPLIHYTFEAAVSSRLLNTLVLSTDCPDIALSASAFPEIQIPFLRPEVLSSDEVPTVDVLRHVVQGLEKMDLVFDYVCLLQPTSPFRGAGLIDLTIETILDANADSLVTVRKVPHRYNPHWVFENRNGNLHISTGERVIIPRRQELPDTFYRDGQVYITHTDLIKDGKMLAENPIGFLNDTGYDINLDTIEDWQQAEIWLQNGYC